MLRFILKAFLFVLLLYIFGILLQDFIDKGVRKTGQFNFQEWNDIVESRINADLLIQGSSKAWVHVSPYALDSAFSLNSYNLGIDGYFFGMQYARFLLYLKYNRKPHYIIQCVDVRSLWKNNDLYMFEQFIPYLKHKIIREAVAGKGVFDIRDFYIPVYKYMHSFSSRDMMIEGLKINFRKESLNNGKYKGFQAQDREWDSSFRNFKNENPHGFTLSIDLDVKKEFENFLNYCKKENIKVILLYTPEYVEAQKLLLNRDSIMSVFRKYANDYKLPFFDYSNDSLCLDTTNFYNSQHLNKIGVAKFNKKLVQELKQVIKD